MSQRQNIDKLKTNHKKIREKIKKIFSALYDFDSLTALRIDVSMPILDVHNLTTTFQLKSGPVSVISNLSYQIHYGEILGLVGESGCGKSVTSLSIMRLLPPNGFVDKGHILFKEKNLLECDEKQINNIRGHHISMIFQEPMTALNPVLTIGEQIIEPLTTHLQISRKEAQHQAIESLQLVGIPSPEQRIQCYPHELSGGMRQRAMIAMSLVTKPQLLIADEPTTALDVTIQAQILELIQNLQEKTGMSVQFITHDLGVISEISDRVMVMYGGTLCEIGPSQDIFNTPKHPYTLALIQARPRLGHRAKRLPTIEGSVPSLQSRPPGCPFQNRCPRVKSECREFLPPNTLVTLQHSVNCFNPLP
jgi:peptide/nickel transport system ATP-binding protein